MFLGNGFIQTKGGGGFDIADVPKVLSSTISASQSDGILVRWDRDMKGTTDVRLAINVIIDGAAAIHPDDVVFNPADRKEMGLIFGTDFTAGQVVTWAYDDQHATETLSSIYNVEADNQTYAVANTVGQHGIGVDMSADSTTVSADSTTITVDKG